MTVSSFEIPRPDGSGATLFAPLVAPWPPPPGTGAESDGFLFAVATAPPPVGAGGFFSAPFPSTPPPASLLARRSFRSSEALSTPLRIWCGSGAGGEKPTMGCAAGSHATGALDRLARIRA